MDTLKKEKVRDYWEDPQTVSLKDENLRHLETGAIAQALRPTDVALDLGCGDGVNSLVYSERVASLLGVDRSSQMIQRARARLTESGRSNTRFEQLATENLPQLDGTFDAIITQRCLINLDSFAEQSQTILQIEKKLRPGGRYLMLECVDDGREELNQLRARMGLEAVPMPWHNCFFKLNQLLPLLENTFDIEDVRDFSIYWLISRLVAPLMKLEIQDPMTKKLDTAARSLQSTLQLPGLKGIGSQRLFILRKKSC